METLVIYANYGCLGAEKKIIYTYGGPHYQATAFETLTIFIPSDWELIETDAGKKIKAPWGWTYDINEVLSGGCRPCFFAIDKDNVGIITPLEYILSR